MRFVSMDKVSIGEKVVANHCHNKRDNSGVGGITNQHRHKKGHRDPYSVRGLKGLRHPHSVRGSKHFQL